jgi:diguanylate cyclase (GGDEF)-like protein
MLATLFGYRSRFSRHSRVLATCALALASSTGNAACLAYDAPRLQQIEMQVRANPQTAQRQIGTELAALGETRAAYRASLLVLLAQAYSVQEQHELSRNAVRDGLALASDPRDPTYINLIQLDAMRPVETHEVAGALARGEAALRAQTQGSPAEACALTTLGLLEHMNDRVDLASMHLTRAFRMSAGTQREPQRLAAGGALAVVLVALRDYTAALSLSRELIAAYEKLDSPYELSAAYYIEGFVLMELGDRKAAQTSLERTRALSESLHDTIGVAYADANLCENSIKLGATREARAYCDSAHRVFLAAELNEPQKLALANIAEIDMAEQKPHAALVLLDEIFAQDGRDLPPFRLADLYKLRGDARRAIGQDRAALDDYAKYMKLFVASKEDERARDAAAMRARFETDRAIERNDFLQRELASQRERLDAQTARLRWMIAAALAGIGVIGLLTYLLFANKRQRSLLTRLAQEDELTGLPNRRFTLRRASRTFERLRATDAPYAIAILDLDHFKRINDTLGHAAGDYVLKAFARVGRESVRDTDILGRWGGEEFLILLPDTPLDLALTIVERVRAAAAQIAGGPLPPDFSVTLSAGLATNQTRAASLEQIIGFADAALYNAKRRGRNFVQVAQESYDASSVQVRRSLRGAGIELHTGGFQADDLKSA